MDVATADRFFALLTLASLAGVLTVVGLVAGSRFSPAGARNAGSRGRGEQ